MSDDIITLMIPELIEPAMAQWGIDEKGLSCEVCGKALKKNEIGAFVSKEFTRKKKGEGVVCKKFDCVMSAVLAVNREKML
jgi:hypothetical protein